ncbi:MAG: (d)CMP kinase [Alphaproteobacteria bacterium]|nr:MAG: (d)CMP kinase [Alphaproteobacteria bacterium]
MTTEIFPADKMRNPLAGIAITVDGPTASGKGTLAKALARHYKMKFLDTGAVYRAVALSMKKQGFDPADTVAAEAAAKNLDFDFRHKGDNVFGVWVAGEEVTDEIRSLEIGQAASQVAAQPAVRAALKDFQVNYAMKWKPLVGVILDGRDCGARICPEAEVKLVLTADVEERGRRRWLEVTAKGETVPLEQVIEQVAARDAWDVQKKNTLLAEDAITIDGTHIDQAAVLAEAMRIVDGKLKDHLI